MSVTPSAQDVKTLSLLASSVPGLGWFAGLVVNVRDEYHGWINTTRPVDLSATLSVYVDDPVPNTIIATVKDMMTHVRKAPTPVIRSGGWPSGHQGGSSLVPSAATDYVPQGLSTDDDAWEDWLKRFPAAADQRLHDMPQPALAGLRQVFGDDLVTALLTRDDELVAVIDDGDSHLTHDTAAFPLTCTDCKAEQKIGGRPPGRDTGSIPQKGKRGKGSG